MMDSKVSSLDKSNPLHLSSLMDSNLLYKSPIKSPKTSDYKKELDKLLEKSHGTSYEAAIRKFIEKKIAERHEQDEFGDDNDRENFRENRIDLASLSSSKYDKPTINDKLNKHQSSKRLEELSAPNKNQTWRGPYVGYGNSHLEKLTTNHLGRQRPPPRETASPNIRRSRSSSRDRNINDDNPILTSSQYVQQIVQFRRGSSPSVVSVSLNDFNKWNEKQQEWKEDAQKKIKDARKKEVIEAKMIAAPL